MKGGLIAAAGAVVAAVALVGMAGPASAGSSTCDVGVRQTTYALGIDRSGVTAGRITTTACMAVQRDLYVGNYGVGDMGGFRLPSTWLVRF